MAITDKTRKILWARSGNRCAMCRTEIVAERNEHNRNLNIGDECHIISQQQNGPRHMSQYGKDYDEYENLILLCKNHHKTIDELWETYTVELLTKIKTNHENWIRTVIDNAKNKAKENSTIYLQRVTSGKVLFNIVCEAHAFQFDHDEFKSKNEADFISGFMQNLQDWGDLAGMVGFEIGQRTQIGFDLNNEIIELEKLGFFIFGERKSSRMTNALKADLGVWDIAILVILRQDNPAIIDSEKIATKIKSATT